MYFRLLFSTVVFWNEDKTPAIHLKKEDKYFLDFFFFFKPHAVIDLIFFVGGQFLSKALLQATVCKTNTVPFLLAQIMSGSVKG